MNPLKDDSYPTRSTLLNRLKDTADHQSWLEFNDLYGKLILGFALKAGLMEDEAKEVVQETMIAAAKNLPEFHYDPKVCSFKTWLLNLSAWRVRDQLRKRRSPSAPQAGRARDAAADDTRRTATAEMVPDPAGNPFEAIWDKEWRTTLLDAALTQVKARVDARQWQIFDLVALKDWPVKDVVKSLGVNAGRVYLVKHRISAAVAKETKQLERQFEQATVEREASARPSTRR
ncbi:MAG: sigma-70 family RNA polymerase sigma factor [Verrucomicrobiota bacterium]|jgi:RNA polymerase sigma-70 factor (ECF subfamily)